MPEGTKSRNVERVAIIGAGTMGGGIAMSFANAGIPVTLIETGEEQLKRGMGVMQKNMRRPPPAAASPPTRRPSAWA